MCCTAFTPDNGCLNFCFPASQLLVEIMDVAIRKRPRNGDHLKLLITKRLELLDLSYIQHGKNVSILLLGTAALNDSV